MPKKYRIGLTVLLVVVITACLVKVCRFDALLLQSLHGPQKKTDAVTPAFSLDDYAVSIDRLAIPGLVELSGLTYNRQRKTLFTVGNRPARIIELSLAGDVIRQVAVSGVDDIEGITHVTGNLYVLVNEPDQRAILVEIADEMPGTTNTIDADKGKSITLGFNKKGNKNFEGVSWDDVGNRLLLVKERNPMKVIALHGFIEGNDASQPLRIEDLDFKLGRLDGIRDLSSITYHEASGHTFLLSDESRLLVDYDQNGHRAGHLSLWRGNHGLKQNVPQAEGVAIDDDKNIYIVSEPNLFYVFRKQNRLESI